MSSVVELESGFSRGNRAHIASDGALRGFPGQTKTRQTSGTVSESPSEILDKLEGRRAIQLRNRSETFSIAIRFGAAAQVTDFRILPGGTYMFPSGVAFEGDIYAIAIGGVVGFASIEFYELP